MRRADRAVTAKTEIAASMEKCGAVNVWKIEAETICGKRRG